MIRALAKILSADNLWGRFLLALLYTLVYDYLFESYIYGLFYYMGSIEYVQIDVANKIVWILLSVLPVAAYQGIKSVVSYLCLFFYLFVYIPFIQAMFVMYGISIGEIYRDTFVMFIFMVIFFQVGNKSIRLFSDFKVVPQISLRQLEIVTLLLTLAIVIMKRDSMHFVNILTQSDDMYSFRQESAQDGSSGIAAYFQGWLSGALYPFLLVIYLKQRKKLKIAGALFGYIILFMIDMQKMTFLMPFALIALNICVKQRELLSKYLHTVFILFISSISYVIFLLKDNELISSIAGLVILRTVCVAGWLTQMYVHFFASHPYTYFSHINIINSITGAYPYNQSLGMTVAYGSQNANANFILMDGIASVGIIGVVIVCILFTVLLLLINSICNRYDKKDLLVLFTPVTAYFLNCSIFTTLLSYGLLVLLVVLVCFKENCYDKKE